MDRDYYVQYYKLEREHWWFRGRLEILEQTIQKKIYRGHPLRILNVGIATGATSIMLQKFGEVVSVEYDAECCEFVKQKLNLDVINASMTALPFENRTFDLICAFDVIEHIEEDQEAVTEALRVLKTDGHFFISVPMYMSLWSDHDLINHHFRRYGSTGLKKLFQAEGIQIDYYSFFNFFLFPGIACYRMLARLFSSKRKDRVIVSDFQGANNNGALQSIFLFILRTERKLLGWGMKLPFGVSAMLIASRKK